MLHLEMNFEDMNLKTIVKIKNLKIKNYHFRRPVNSKSRTFKN